jgi:hypothetical protein
LKSISIPKSVTSIGELAFCTKSDKNNNWLYFDGEILKLPDFMLNCENGYGGIYIKATARKKATEKKEA